MKTTTRILAIAATAVVLGAATTWADDPALQNRLAAQNRQTERNQAGVTIGFYNQGRGIGRVAKSADRAEVRVQEHFTPHGTAHYFFVPAK